MLQTFPQLAVISASLCLAAANCQLPSDGTSAPASGSQLCVPEGEGTSTAAMYINDVEIPTGADDPNSGNVSSNESIIYDNGCNVQGVYGTEPNSNCGTPFVIEENFLADDITITNVNLVAAKGAGGADFEFLYGNGNFGSDEKNTDKNNCACDDMSSGFEAAVGCRCVLPVYGNSN